MKKFLWVDESGRGFSAEWSEDEIRADIEDGAAGVFYEYDRPDDDDDAGAEPISEWLDRCSPGDEYELDAARLVCTGDDSTAPMIRRECFSTEFHDNGQRVVVRDSAGDVVAELRRVQFGDALSMPENPRSAAAAADRWRALVALIAGE